eukprot:CAMPEP_0172500164 /NCGR_PEP_ID=MMETSP1066-20121228/135286_1 /TAXON_ID=671091 /ORGANISM="Coscinodiscus wailesii, Strain CCMP2513" /LENGTH=389 /DNA_ID=CAMNT_0013274267 /DNA_START=15 /DNA_END=1184 /DNA_ORIENTATION=+
MSSATKTFDIKLSFKGKTATIPNNQSSITVGEINELVRNEFNLSDNVALKLLHKGKVISQTSIPNASQQAFPKGITTKSAKIMVMATSDEKVTELNSSHSDPTIRGFENEKTKPGPSKNDSTWGPAATGQHRQYKFCKFVPCTWQSFGHRTGSKTPHAFKALALLEKLATDPGIVAIMTERELVVNTLGEMDPVDDRIMQKKQESGACLLGYNTNSGLRIDVRLRTKDLNGFLPYNDIAATLIHELSHNWVAEHNALFWSNYGQMRVEYLHKHATLASSGYYVDGKTTAEVAGVEKEVYTRGMQGVFESVAADVKREVLAHGVPVEMVLPAIRARCEEIGDENCFGVEGGQRVGGGDSVDNERNRRELVLAAAERRARENRKNDKKNSP